jgi:hypothetical protein
VGRGHCQKKRPTCGPGGTRTRRKSRLTTSAGARSNQRGNIDAHDHVTEAGATRRAAPEPVNGRWNLRGRTVQTERLERGVVPCTALHAHVAEPRRCRMRRYADRLTCSFVDMSERRAGQHTNGQNRCRSHGEEPLPHRSSPSRRTTLHSFLYRIVLVSTSEARSHDRASHRFFDAVGEPATAVDRVKACLRCGGEFSLAVSRGRVPVRVSSRRGLLRRLGAAHESTRLRSQLPRRLRRR